LLAIFGLGNPGKKYQDTRHNIGFIILDYIALNAGIPFKYGKGDYYFADMMFEGEKVMLAKPATYMNVSGRAVYQLSSYFKLSVEDLLIVYDDFQLPLGTIRFRQTGSDGGHNGIKSIIETLGTLSVNRLRIGIGDPSYGMVDYVLSPFSRQDRNIISEILPIVSDGVKCWITQGIERAMTLYNRSYKDDI
jgi:PTH1 family peptidyl-tRNA hydrolase